MTPRRPSPRAFAWINAALALLIAFCASDSLEPRELAAALSEEMTDEMEFDNGTLAEGEPPAAHEGDAAYPQIEQMELSAGAKGVSDTPPAGQVNTTMLLTYTSSNRITLRTAFAAPREIVGAVVHVLQANKDSTARRHFVIRFPQSPLGAANGLIQLSLRVKNPARIAGNAFRLRIALLRETPALGLSGVGNYAELTFLAPPIEGVTPRVKHCTCLEGKIVPIGACPDSAVLGEIKTREKMCLLWAKAFLGKYFSLSNASLLGDVPMPSGTQAFTWTLAAVTAAAPTPTPGPCLLELRCP